MHFPFLKKYYLLSALCFIFFAGRSGNAKPFLDLGWKALVEDNDTLAVKYFELAFKAAQKENNTEDIANSLLHLGICYYGVSSDNGLEYAFKAMAKYKNLEVLNPSAALTGRSKCLQLISTIFIRRGKYLEAIALSHEALSGMRKKNEGGYRGLMFNSLGRCYAALNKMDSSEFYYRSSLHEQLTERNFAYLPAAYTNVAEIELKRGNKLISLQLYNRAFQIADSTNNNQARVTCLLGKGDWFRAFGNTDSAGMVYTKALSLAETLRDRSFSIKALEQLYRLKKESGDYKQSLDYQEQIIAAKDSSDSYDRIKLAKTLEVQFKVAEKDRKLELLKKERDITQLSNYILWGSIVFLLIISLGVIIFLKRINQRNKQLLQTKEELVNAIEKQKQIREQYLQNELEFKESQLSAMAIQILQKNELMQELKQQLEKIETKKEDSALARIINKGFNHDKEWDDFNRYFESVNRNFYAKLKAAYPEISPNDLKICALIKLNLSSKDMAGILNISPDSVKTARYRLRKKLQMNPEDNLGDFIMSL